MLQLCHSQQCQDVKTSTCGMQFDTAINEFSAALKLAKDSTEEALLLWHRCDAFLGYDTPNTPPPHTHCLAAWRNAGQPCTTTEGFLHRIWPVLL